MIIDPRGSFKVENLEEVESKSYGPATSFTEFLWRGGNGDLSAFSAIGLYEKAMPLFNAVDMRATAFSQIPVKLWDKAKKQFVESHKVLDLLSAPNADTSQVELLEQISSFYDITGNSFMVCTGNIAKPPLELISAPPQFANFSSGTDSKFGLLSVPAAIRISTNGSSNEQITYAANETPKLGLRYIAKDQMKELWQMRSFNANRSANNAWGMSRARSVWLEIEQYISGNNTNLSMLKRGTRMSLAWVNNRGEELTDKQFSRLQEEAQKYSGDMNAGGTPILDGMDVKAIQQTNKDMEFKDLQEAMLARISTIYGIPLPLLLDSSMTLNNLETSMLQFFDRAVLPLANRIYDEMSRFLLPRYPNSENLEFRFNENDISAVRGRIVASAKDQEAIGVNTINEIRTLIGYEGLLDGGDDVYRPSNDVPVGMDAFKTDELRRPIVKAKFIELLCRKGYSLQAAQRAAAEHIVDTK